MEEYKLKNYLNHLDKEGLQYLIVYLLKDTEEAKEKLTMMAEEWDKMYGRMI